MPSKKANPTREELLSPGREFSIPEAREIVNCIYEDDDNPIDTRSRFHNNFFYEICPLVVIAEHPGIEATGIIFMGADARFDGLLLLGDEGRAQKVEMTAAIDGHNDALQMELLKERGHAPAFQKIEATGTQKNRKFGKNKLEAISSKKYNQETLLPFLEGALAHKKEEAKKNPDYIDAWLGIVFDDWNQPSKEKKPGRFDLVCRQMLGVGPEHYAPFSRVFCIGVSRQYLFDSWEVYPPYSAASA